MVYLYREIEEIQGYLGQFPSQLCRIDCSLMLKCDAKQMVLGFELKIV